MTNLTTPEPESAQQANPQPGYYAVIPADVRYNRNLPPNAKLLYGEITALCNKEGFCWATNEYFAKLYGVKLLAVKRWVKALESEGFVHIFLNTTGTQRRIFIDEAVSKKIRGGIKNNTGWYPKAYAPRTKKDTQNTTSDQERNKTKNTAAPAQGDGSQAGRSAPQSSSLKGKEKKEPDDGLTTLQRAKLKNPALFRAARQPATEEGAGG